jgi:hypothetical protein
VARRTRALLERPVGGGRLKKSALRLAELEQACRQYAVTEGAARAELYVKLCAVRRAVMFANPLLKGIDKLVFITREALPPEGIQLRHAPG